MSLSGPKFLLPQRFLPFAAMRFENLPSLDDHIRAEHYSLVCTVCDKTLRSKPDVNLHKHKYHGTLSEKEQHPLAQVHRNEAPVREMLNEATTNIRCDVCGSESETENDLVTHIVTHHQQLQLTNSDNTATNTSDAPTKSISVSCLFCGKTFPNDLI